MIKSRLIKNKSIENVPNRDFLFAVGACHVAFVHVGLAPCKARHIDALHNWKSKFHRGACWKDGGCTFIFCSSPNTATEQQCRQYFPSSTPHVVRILIAAAPHSMYTNAQSLSTLQTCRWFLLSLYCFLAQSQGFNRGQKGAVCSTTSHDLQCS